MLNVSVMEVTVKSHTLRGFSSTVRVPSGSTLREVLDRFVHQQLPLEDFYVVSNGRRVTTEQHLVHGAVYHLEPRLLGGKGGFGSMLRALGAQIEKTTNREACRDLSGRRLRDVNHEKEMGEWLKKQAEREAEKEQRRVERLQRKLSEPNHLFSDPEYQKQCHDLSERLEESVLKGLQASSGSQVKAAGASKRRSGEQSKAQKEKRMRAEGAAASCFWSGVDGLSEEDEDEEQASSSDVGVSQDLGGAELTNSLKATSPQTPEPTTADPPMTEPTTADPPMTEPTTADPPMTEPTTADPPMTHAEGMAVCSASPQSLGVSMATSPQQLEALGLDVLKAELKARGVKCGGTLSERAVRLFSIRGQGVQPITKQ